nr:MAG: ORF1 [Torque teno midi virus]
MPFWWNRRRKPWYTTWRKRRRLFWNKRRKKYNRRRKPRRFARRRRRRRRTKKVRRKRKQILIKQWQPDSIVKCKIKGLGCLVAGAEGRQSYCYTNEIPSYPHPKAPGGGGFGCEVFSLKYLYDEWVAHRNIWTKSNEYKDLCRYTGTKIILYSHPTTDFVFSYTRMPPFNIEKYTYSDFHPIKLLLSRHHKIILSKKSNPTGKLRHKIRIGPPKQMITKWFFQKEFATAGLFQMQASAINLGFAYFGPNTQSALLTLYSLNTKFYTNASYGKTTNEPYKPYSTYPTQGLDFYYDRTKPQAKKTIQVTATTTYLQTVDYNTGFFQKAVLNAWKVTQKDVVTPTLNTPVTIIRYNPQIDTGENTRIWLTSIHSDTWEAPQDKDLIMVGRPLWLAFFGFWNWIEKAKMTKDYFKTHIFVVQSDAIRRISNTEQKVFPLIDFDFTQGKLPYDEFLTDQKKQFWYPTAENQVVSINSIVESGPYIPKYSNQKDSTWELKYTYTSFFKWGGPEIQDTPVQNPGKQGEYDVPDKQLETIQVSNPLKESCQAMLRAWDYRRGIITTTALKRMQSNLSVTETYQSDSETPKKKRKITAQLRNPQEENKEIQTCLHSLFEESTCQDPQASLQQLIQHQQQQQEKLKLNIIHLLTDLKRKQRMIQLQTGFE